ncbi:hypothetical protein QCA50_014912 [Cerrena zonata]|uniref:Glucose-methanol-choline oxidoreductase C-terminal domain-containing protein n=1 Tax=Cerrena zonata TaxID=2478898 RepID=A0AAW0FSV1_9APHY
MSSVSAGNLKSPQILELSGIGDPAILEQLGIETVVTLPAVGTNVQDHYSCVGPIPEFKDGNDIITWNLLQDPNFRATLKDPYEEIERPLSSPISGFTFYPVQKTTVDIEHFSNEFTAKIDDPTSFYSPGLKEQYRIQLDLLNDETIPHLQMMVTPFAFFPLGPLDKPYVDIESVLCRPFSRGTVHINSADPHDAPTIDMHLFEEEIDLELLIAGFKMARHLTRSSYFKDIVEQETQPKVNVATDEEIKDYVRTNTRSTQGSVGSCAMLPREKGGVVDPKLKVYGTKNLRVVDVSIIPLIVSSPLQATAYAIAEQAADIIKANFA